MASSLEGKAALVTGASSGIGRATALLLARAGAKVVLADLAQPGGEETRRLIQAAGGEALFIKTDVTQTHEVQRLVDQTVEAYGRLDCAFNNAGIARIPVSGAAECSEEEWMAMIGVNLTGVWLCMKYEIRQMLHQGGGAIVNTASVMGLVGTTSAAYAASKHGVVGLTKSAALSYSKSGIRVNAVCPGFIDTPMIESITDSPQGEEDLIRRHPIGRLGTPAEVAEAVLWLCTPASSFVTGHMLTVDGAYTAQ